MGNNIRLASAFVLFALMVGSLISSGTSAAGQDQPAVIKTSLQVTARTLNFYGKNRNMWSWVPYFRFSLTRAPAAAISTTSNTPSQARGLR